MITIDAHHHFWDPARGDYDWMTPGMAHFYRVFGPADLAGELSDCSVGGTVLVQAAPTDAECDYLLDIADRTPWVRGVVGWFDLQSPRAADRIAARAVHPKLVGIRPMLQDQPDVAWIAEPVMSPAFRALAAADLTFDALIRVHQSAVIATLAEHNGDLAIVVDHAAKPDIERSERTRWVQAMRALARHSNVVCKLSGLLTEAGPGADASSLRFYVDTLLEIFGPSRLLWGSDWPVLTAASDYRSWMSMTRELLADLSAESRAAIMGGNAVAFYGLETG